MTDYVKMANDFAEKHGVTLTTIGEPEYKRHFNEDKHCRYVFKMRLKRKRKQYTFDFGQSIADGDKTPDMYSVLACLTKCDSGSYENFLSEFGYEKDANSFRTYKAVCREYKAVERLFGDIMEELQEIY